MIRVTSGTGYVGSNTCVAPAHAGHDQPIANNIRSTLKLPAATRRGAVRTFIYFFSASDICASSRLPITAGYSRSARPTRRCGIAIDMRQLRGDNEYLIGAAVQRSKPVFASDHVN